MLIFGETKIAKEKFYAAKKTTNIWHINVDNVDISKLIETKPNFKYLVGIKFDKPIKPLVFKINDSYKDENNKLMSFCVDDEKLLEKKAIWTKIKDLKNVKF